MRTQIEHCNASLSSGWRNDASQVVCLLIMISCTVLGFLASSCATCSKASFTLSKANSVAFTSVLKMLLYSSHPLLRAIKPCFIILCVSQCHRSIPLAPSTLWLAIPAATDLEFLPAFLLQPALGTSLLHLFLGKSIPTLLARIVLFPLFFQNVRLFSTNSCKLPLLVFSPSAFRESL